jgi:hypothetical protein
MREVNWLIDPGTLALLTADSVVGYKRRTGNPEPILPGFTDKGTLEGTPNLL